MKKKKIIIIILLIICLGILIYSLIHIINWNEDNKLIENEINSLNNIVDLEESEEGENVNEENETPESLYWKYVKMNMISVDFSSLKKINPDVKGWIQVNGTNANYPFVQTNDNSYYLTHSFEKKYTDAGWIFLDYRNDINNLSYNNILYGHARKDKTMFGTLKNTLNKNWFNNTDNHIIKLSTEKENTLWQIFSVYHIETETYYITTDFNNNDEFIKFTKELKRRSKYNFDVNLNENDKILTLSTCYNDKRKLVIHAKLIKREAR